jgi:hypothetical protein
MMLNAEELLILRRIGIAPRERALAESIITEIRRAATKAKKDGFEAGKREATKRRAQFFRGPQ